MHKYPHIMAIGAGPTAGPAKVPACSPSPSSSAARRDLIANYVSLEIVLVSQGKTPIRRFL